MIKHDPCGSLFIFYGLLKNGAKNAPAHIPMDRAGEYLGACRFYGEMFDTGGYPGVRDGKAVCTGQLYRLDDASILPLLDEFEACDMGDPAGSLYQRRKVAYFDGPPEQDAGEAWIYWYTAENRHMPVIPTGDWPLAGWGSDAEAVLHDG